MRTAAILMILATSAAVWMSASYGWPVEGPQEEVQFANWLRGLREEALEAGISEATVEIALAGIIPIGFVNAARWHKLDKERPRVIEHLVWWPVLEHCLEPSSKLP